MRYTVYLNPVSGRARASRPCALVREHVRVFDRPENWGFPPWPPSRFRPATCDIKTRVIADKEQKLHDLEYVRVLCRRSRSEAARFLFFSFFLAPAASNLSASLGARLRIRSRVISTANEKSILHHRSNFLSVFPFFSPSHRKSPQFRLES